MIPPVLCSLIRLSAYIITILQCDANIFIHRRQKTTQKSLTMMNIKFVYRILDRKLIRVSYFEGKKIIKALSIKQGFFSIIGIALLLVIQIFLSNAIQEKR